MSSCRKFIGPNGNLEQQCVQRQVQISELELRVWDEQAVGRRTLTDMEQQLATANAEVARFQNRSLGAVGNCSFF